MRRPLKGFLRAYKVSREVCPLLYRVSQEKKCVHHHTESVPGNIQLVLLAFTRQLCTTNLKVKWKSSQPVYFAPRNRMDMFILSMFVCEIHISKGTKWGWGRSLDWSRFTISAFLNLCKLLQECECREMMGMFCCWNCFFSSAEEDLVCKDGAFEFQRGWFFHPVGGFKEVGESLSPSSPSSSSSSSTTSTSSSSSPSSSHSLFPAGDDF